jgi:hypothetical protein
MMLRNLILILATPEDKTTVAKFVEAVGSLAHVRGGSPPSPAERPVRTARGRPARLTRGIKCRET